LAVSWSLRALEGMKMAITSSMIEFVMIEWPRSMA
jgi:hypothetical protein